ncbi:zinc finger protein 142-like isoform X2 [Cylas formicarius]|uniref:zinc finger protein 142-like isoform X2 n=1 Tax=Cylas formicarius TaxID=197179 RepID=UPI002958D710|nr:zinc finger protein 142-like isoform X2 [Cylas formicarius]
MSASNPRKRTRKSVREAEPAQKRTRTKIERPDVETKAAQEEECGSVSKEVSAGIDAPTSSFGAAPRDGADCQVGEGESKADTSAPVVNGLRIIRRTNRSNSEAEKKWLELISGTSSNNSGSTIEGAEKKQITNTKIKTRKRRARESTPIVEFLGVNADAPPPMPPPAADGPKKFYEKALTCDRCQYRTKSRDMLTQHQLIHNLIDSVKKFRCKSCSFQAKSQELLDQHKLTHLDVNTTYKCVYCEFKAKKKVSLLHHIIRHEDKPVDKEFFCCYINCDEPTEAYECLQCEFQSAAWDTLVSHVADHEATNTCNPNIEMFKCSFCSYKTKTEELLSRHEELHKFPKYIKKSDESDTLLKCDKCAFATVNKRSLQNHFSKKHGSKDEKKPKPQSDELFYCAQCPYLTDRKPNITRHVLVHMTKKNVEFWECPHCPFETKHRRSYIRHMVCVHNVVV